MLKDAWKLAVETLTCIDLRRLGEHLALSKVAEQLEMKDPRVLRLAHKLIFETLRRLNVIDSILNVVSAPNSVNDFKLDVRSFLRLYTYQVLFEGADFERAVAIARTGRRVLGWRQLSNVEEALGKVLSVHLVDVLKGGSDEEHVALQTYNPSWFVKYCFKMLGRNEALSFLESVSEPTPTYVRLNTLQTSEEECLRKLEKEGVVVEKEPHLKYTYKVTKIQKPLTRTQSFREGFFFVQDKASCLAAEVADPKAGETVLDVCAAPAAKTTFMAQLMRNQGRIYSVDYSRRRINVWMREIRRMGVKNAMAIVADAQNLLPMKPFADLVTLDPPCTSTGAFAKAPAAKWRLTKRSVLNMAKIQWNMMNACAEMVKECGYLIYSTCSVSLEENEMLIERFLKRHVDFKLEETTPRIGLPGFRGQSQCQRLYPHLHHCNGFFIAKLFRETSEI
jgi:16S rRNA (cytosine967-C5)-methyltransferase